MANSEQQAAAAAATAAGATVLPALTASPDPIAAQGGQHDDVLALAHGSAGGQDSPLLADGSKAPHPFDSAPSVTSSTAEAAAAAAEAEAAAGYPSPSGTFIPPPTDDAGAAWTLRNPPSPAQRQSKAQSAVSAADRLVSPTTAEAAQDATSAMTSSATLKRVSAASSTTSSGLPPARPVSIPPSFETAERIASAASSRRESGIVPSDALTSDLGGGASSSAAAAGGSSPGMRAQSASRRSSSTRGSKRISGLSLSSRSGVSSELDEGEGNPPGGGSGAATPNSRLGVNTLVAQNMSQSNSASRRASRSPSGLGFGFGAGGATGVGSASSGLSSTQAKHLSTASSRSGAQLSPTSEHPLDDGGGQYAEMRADGQGSKRASTATSSSGGASGSGTGSGVAAGAIGGVVAVPHAASPSPSQQAPRRRVQRGTSYLSTATSTRTSVLIGQEARVLKVRDFGYPADDPRHTGISLGGDLDNEDDEEDNDEDQDDADESQQWRTQTIAQPQRRSRSSGSDQPATVASPEEHDYDSWQSTQHDVDVEDDGAAEQGEGSTSQGLPPGWYTALYAFDAESTHELTVQPGERLLVVGALEGGWAIVEREVEAAAGADDGAAGGEAAPASTPQRGLVPEAYLQWLGEA